MSEFGFTAICNVNFDEHAIMATIDGQKQKADFAMGVQVLTDSKSQTVTLSANLFFDCVNSSCAVPFYLEGDKDGDGKTVKNQFVEWNGRRYGVKTIEPIYDNKKLHHYEVGLI